MLKRTLLLIILLVTISLNAQLKLEQELDSIVTVDQAIHFLESKKSKQNEIITFNEEKHKTELSKELLSLDVGRSVVINKDIDKVHYKVLEKNNVSFYRVNYVFLDGNELSIEEINNLIPRIIAKLNAGVPFSIVANEYSMDINKTRGGDSGWLTYGEMPSEFEKQIMNDSHSIGDIFSVNIEVDKSYYVIKKTFETKSITEIKVLKVIENVK